MAISYVIAIDQNDDGDFVDLNEAFTQDVLAMRWRLGMKQPFDSFSAPSWAQIVVRSDSRAYSPEVNPLLPGKRLRIQSDDGTLRTHFTGFISHIEPQPGDLGGKTAVIHAQGPERWFDESRVRLNPQSNVTADQVIDQILDQTTLRRPVLDGYMIVGVSGYNLVGTHRLFGEAIARSLEAGKSIFAYAGDTWGSGIEAGAALREVASSERGRLWINRDGEVVFYNRHHTLVDTVSDASFSDSMDALEYAYGADIVNRVRVRILPRSIGAPGTILWQLASPQILAPDAIHRLVAHYRDENANPLGAVSVDVPQPVEDYTVLSSSGADLTGMVEVQLIEAGASAALLEIQNRSGKTARLMSLTLSGTPLHRGDEITLEQQDAFSITFYGPKTLSLNLPALTSIDEADQIARYELARRKDPRGTVHSLSLSTWNHAAQVLSRTLFDRITITETQTGHSAPYFIIAEEHDVDLGGARHHVRWLVEPADSETFFIVGLHTLGSDRVLAY